MIFNDLVEAVGHTPVVRLRTARSDVTVAAKLELQNLFAMKDRVARQVVLEARANGVLAPGAPIIESSSGTMALGLALAGHALGHPVHIVTDPRIDAITRAKLTALGCSVHVVEAMTANGWQSARLERLAALRAEYPGAFWPRQYSNPQNPLAYAALADELVADLGRVDVLVGAVGSGGSLCGTARALRRALKAAGSSGPLRVIGVDAVGSVLFGQPDQPGRRQSGIGNSLIPANLDYAEIDEIHWLNDREAFVATRELAQEEGLFAGNSSGSVYRVLRHLADTVAPGTRVVGIFPDRGIAMWIRSTTTRTGNVPDSPTSRCGWRRPRCATAPRWTAGPGPRCRPRPGGAWSSSSRTRRAPACWRSRAPGTSGWRPYCSPVGPAATPASARPTARSSAATPTTGRPWRRPCVPTSPPARWLG